MKDAIWYPHDVIKLNLRDKRLKRSLNTHRGLVPVGAEGD